VADNPLAAAAQKHLAKLTGNARECLLLSVIEGFSVPEIAGVMSLTRDEVRALLDTAYREMQDAVAGRILVIEDEAIIAMDLENIVASLGHSVTGVARTRAGAVTLAGQERPDLILADIHLADDSSGIDAVREIVGAVGHLPVIFITAYPERLLKGERYEPAFMIAKPYTEEQVKVAVSQAMFFASTETLRA
jgi:CheY-like chemotaxis protein